MAKKYFKVDARAMLTLGRESIKDHTTAVLELVKNSYDARASVVEVCVNTRDTDTAKRFIRLSDNGHGMSEDDVEKLWLRIGYSSKRLEKTPSGQRRKVGEKGVGRISSDRLGAVLQLFSQKQHKEPVGLLVNWDDFDRPGTDLEKIGVEVIASPSFEIPRPSAFEEETNQFQNAPAPKRNSPTVTGTELTIRELRQDWSKADIGELCRELATLTPPFDDVKGFQVRLITDVDPASDGVVTSAFSAVAEIDATFTFQPGQSIEISITDRDLKGKARKPKERSMAWSNLIHPIVSSPSDTPSNSPTKQNGPMPPAFGPIEVRLLFFPRKASTVRGTGLSLGDLREFLEMHDGVKIYRDGIRVLPYGDLKKPDGDWLGLTDRKMQNPAGAAREDFRISASQLVGAVFISRDKNPALVDTSGREGLVEGDAFHQLRQFLMGCVIQLENHYHQVYRDQLAAQPPPPNPRKQVIELRKDLKELSQNLRDVQASLPRSASRTVEKIRDQLDDTQKRITESRKSLDELASQATIFRGLATLGIAAATFGHETSVAIDAFLLHIQTARNLLHANSKHTDKIIGNIEESVKLAEHVSSWGSFALRRLNRDKRRRRKISVHEVIADLLGEMEPLFAGSEVTLRTKLRDVEGRAFAMDVESVVVNLVSNAYYFCKQKQRNRAIGVALRPRNIDAVPGFDIIVSDSGPGVAEGHRERIWEPLFTTKVDSAGRPAGTGLGLAIVQSVISDLGGKGEVGSDDDLGGAKFTIWLPLLQER